ncbi:hypothetical protein [Serratia entomophila]|uniref:hypothetical protein n=1 Tax=Serratia entomophila TaxID=42906 RepID=UPI0021BB54B0|nr:hypothetical protein [Serratia entomophila]
MAIEIAAVSHTAIEPLLVKNLQGKRLIAIINRLILYKVIGERNTRCSAADHTDPIHEISPYSYCIKIRTIASGVGINRLYSLLTSCIIQASKLALPRRINVRGSNHQ